MNCKSNSSGDLERRFGGGGADICELCASGGDSGRESRENLKVANNSKFRKFIHFNNLEVAPDTKLGIRK